MPLSSNSAIALPTVPIPVPSIPRRQANCRKFSIKCSNENFSGQRIITFSPYRRKHSCLTNSVSSDGNNSINVDVPFPSDYSELLDQFFPEANEVKFARKSVFEGASFKLDYLTKPSFFEDFGFTEKVKMADRVKLEDELFLVAYPYFNVNEMLVVEELYKEAVFNTAWKLIIFNGELDRIRSGYYPSFFYPKLAALSKTLFPVMETIYYIHNFKGRNGGTLFRCYPGSWKVLKKVSNKYICLHQQEVMPSLKEVALDILPSA
ncbi:hypothetical protein CISIN_1g020394mg [Citrus sinensis]|uniref:DUF1995 domain-containing protein n=1 Tax=Citrus sinensis TaxID=2711 RepID=A0A067DQF0_CITSI|nr:hypothetical protein CISIN_1g020394mg [Citrus sinensis]